MPALTDAELQRLLASLVWPMLRVSGFVLTAPVLGTRTVPPRVKVVVLLALSAAVAPLAGEPPAYALASGPGLVTSVQQLVIGAALGLSIRVVFLVLELAGQVIAMQMGLGFAAMVDPQSGSQVPVVSQFYVVVATLLFLSFNGHLMLVQVLADSFRILPVSTAGLAAGGMALALEWAGWLFAQAVVVALPALTALLLVNFAFGVMTRAAPQLNIFAVGFPVMILGGMLIALLTLGVLTEHMRLLFGEAFANARAMLAAP